MLNSDSIYVPLSQVISDTESEEEKYTSKDFHQRLRSTIQGSASNSNIHNSLQNSHQQQQHVSLSNSNFSNCKMSNLVSSDTGFTGLAEGSIEELNTTDADNIAILGGDSKHKHSLSPARKCCFILSILLCVFTIVIFLWGVPCNEDSSCPALADRIKTHNWLNQYNKFELKGMINIVHGVRSWERNLIFMYRADKFFPDKFDKNNHKRNGIISLIGNSGKISWYNEMENEPISVDCQLMDINSDKKNDCLVIDEYGELGAFDPLWGLWLWKFKENSTHKIDILDFPFILPDLDNDGICELLMATSNNNEKRNLLRIISGANGQLLGSGYEISDCTHIRKFQLEEQNLVISFICIKSNGTEIQLKRLLTDLYALVTNKLLQYKVIKNNPKIPEQHKVYGQRKETINQQNLYYVGNKKLLIENKGKCPEDCNMTITWSETVNNRDKILGGINETKMYGMVPASYEFKSRNGKPPLSGFVLKIWEWMDSKTDNSQTENKEKSGDSKRLIRTLKEYSSQKIRIDKESVNDAANGFLKSEKYDIFSNVVKKHSTFSLPLQKNLILRQERSIVNNTKPITNNNYFMRIIKQKVILIIFNSAPRIENTSQSNIVQFCRKTFNTRTSEVDEECQPDLNYQENSLSIADLDQDGSQELVSYYTTFSKDDNEWILKTYVQLLRLESELPILFEDIKGN